MEICPGTSAARCHEFGRICGIGGAPGGPFVLRVTSPGGLFAETAFTYVPDPDPEITGVSPDEADRSGGKDQAPPPRALVVELKSVAP